MVAQIHALEEQSSKQAAATASNPAAAAPAAGVSVVTEGTLHHHTSHLSPVLVRYRAILYHGMR